jgi:hypothetical protein
MDMILSLDLPGKKQLPGWFLTKKNELPEAAGHHATTVLYFREDTCLGGTSA